MVVGRIESFPGHSNTVGSSSKYVERPEEIIDDAAKLSCISFVPRIISDRSIEHTHCCETLQAQRSRDSLF